MKCLVFDIWGDFAHFRKFYTTSSPLTFSFPPRTALSGLISAIIGLDKDIYQQYFDKSQAYIAVSIINPVKKKRLSYNLIDTKTAKQMSKIANRTQVTFELLRDCRYRIYFYHTNEEIYNKMKECLVNHSSVYTPCLGLSEYLANFQYVGEYSLVGVENSSMVYCDTVIPFYDESIKVEFEIDKEYFKDTLPNEMNEDREVTQYLKVLYERNGQRIKSNIKSFYKTDGGQNIVFL